MREKMVELIRQIVIPFWAGEIADHLISNDVVPVVRCKDCQFCYNNPCNELMRCTSQKGLNRIVDALEYCSYGDRKEGDADV